MAHIISIRASRKTLSPGKGPLRNLLRSGGLAPGLAPAADNALKRGFHLPFATWLRDPNGLAPPNDHGLMEGLMGSQLFSPAAVSLVRQYREGRLEIPWTIPYLLLV